MLMDQLGLKLCCSDKAWFVAVRSVITLIADSSNAQQAYSHAPHNDHQQIDKQAHNVLKGVRTA